MHFYFWLLTSDYIAFIKENFAQKLSTNSPNPRTERKDVPVLSWCSLLSFTSDWETHLNAPHYNAAGASKYPAALSHSHVWFFTILIGNYFELADANYIYATRRLRTLHTTQHIIGSQRAVITFFFSLSERGSHRQDTLGVANCLGVEALFGVCVIFSADFSYCVCGGD